MNRAPLLQDTPTALLAAIKANPEDEAPRLVFADWLDENGEEERAAFIRGPRLFWRRERYGRWGWMYQLDDGTWRPVRPASEVYRHATQAITHNPGIEPARRSLHSVEYWRGFVDRIDLDHLNQRTLRLLYNRVVAQIDVPWYDVLRYADALNSTTVRRVQLKDYPTSYHVRWFQDKLIVKFPSTKPQTIDTSVFDEARAPTSGNDTETACYWVGRCLRARCPQIVTLAV